MGSSRRWRRLLVGGFAVALAGALTACTGDGASPDPTRSVPTTSVAESAVTFGIQPATGAKGVSPADPVTVTVAGGRVSEVQLTGPDGQSVTGTTDALGVVWTADDQLRFGTTYTLIATAVDPAGNPAHSSSTFTTSDPPADAMRARVAPLDGETVGVGMPVAVYLTKPVTDRAAVERRMSVTTVPAVEGSWSWLSSTEIHWRPKDPWPVGTEVHVHLALNGAHGGADVFGDEDRDVSFTIADHEVRSVVDLAAGTVAVSVDGTVARTLEIAASNPPGWEIRNGTTVILSAEESATLDASTIGLKPGDPGYYSFTAPYALRLTWTGEFIHGVPQAGVPTQVAAGSIGLAGAGASWLFGLTTRGDLVTVQNSPRGIDPGSGYLDWNTAWDDWLRGSALSATTSPSPSPS